MNSNKQVWNILLITFGDFICIYEHPIQYYNFTSKTKAYLKLIDAINIYNDMLEEQIEQENEDLKKLSQNRPLYYNDFVIMKTIPLWT